MNVPIKYHWIIEQHYPQLWASMDYSGLHWDYGCFCTSLVVIHLFIVFLYTLCVYCVYLPVILLKVGMPLFCWYIWQLNIRDSCLPWLYFWGGQADEMAIARLRPLMSESWQKTSNKSTRNLLWKLPVMNESYNPVSKGKWCYLKNKCCAAKGLLSSPACH